MVALSVGKKRKLGVLSSILAKIVWAVGLMAILVSCGEGPGYNYTVGGTVSGLAGSGLVLQNNAGDNRSISNTGGFSFATPLDNGTAYTVTVKTPPGVLSQTCTVSNGSGTISNVPVGNVVVSCVTPPPHSVTVYPFLPPGPGKFAYVANTGSNNIWAYKIDSTSGALTSPTTVPAGRDPYSVTVDPSGKFAYVANTGDNTISAYQIDSTSGALTNPTTVPTGMAPYLVTVYPFIPPGPGKFAYAANTGDNTISAYTIDSTTGALTAIAGSPFAAGRNPYFVTVDPSGKFAYTANNIDNTISVYTIDPTSGALTFVESVAAGARPYFVTVYPFIPPGPGKFAYVANTSSNTISAYTIDSTTGALTAIAGSPFAAGTKPFFVTVDPSGQFAYAANTGDNTISAYTIDSTTGALTAIAGNPFAAGVAPYFVTVSGNFAYVANTGDNTISVYTIQTAGPTPGALTAGTAVLAGTAPSSVTVDPSGQFAYAANYSSNNISAYKIDSTTGALTNRTTVATGTNPY